MPTFRLVSFFIRLWETCRSKAMFCGAWSPVFTRAGWATPNRCVDGPLAQLRSWERLTVDAHHFPGTRSDTAWVQAMKRRWNCSGSSRGKTSPKVSWDVMPWGSYRDERSGSCVELGV